jgi:hypothetical protein
MPQRNNPREMQYATIEEEGFKMRDPRCTLTGYDLKIDHTAFFELLNAEENLVIPNSRQFC